MNIRRIIREEMNSLSDSFYLIVSTDEKYIYGSIENQTYAGNKFRPIKDYTIKDIVNSKYISYEQAEHPIEWSKSTLKNGANVTMTQIELANNILKYNPKIITIDLILNKRDDNFPMMESEIDGFDWIRDVKTNDTIAKEIYGKLNWIKRPNVTTDYVTNPWNKDLPFAVRDRASADYNDKEFIKQALITPSSFHKGFKDYVRENYDIFYMSDIKEVFYKIKELMGDKVRGTINESDDLDWIRDVEPPNFNFLVGKALYFEPCIDNMVDLKRILEVLSGMGFAYGTWANKKYIEDGDEIVGLYLDPIDNNIVYTDFIPEDYEEHISEWAEKPVEVLDGWLTL